MRLPLALALTVLAALLFGCGGSDDSTTSDRTRGPVGASSQTCTAPAAPDKKLQATGAGCAEARRVMAGWMRQRDCRPPQGSSRSGCPVGSYRCLATATGRGWSVSCAEAGKSVGFTARRR